MIELRQLRHFLAVVDHGGVRRAARRIPLSPSSVARSVKLLETRYGVPLLVRRGKQVLPTAFGRQLAEEARTVLAGVDGIEHRLGQLSDLSRGTLRVALAPAVADVFLPPVGARFLRDHPGVSMETRLGHASEMLAWLVEREVDVAIAHEDPFSIHGGLEVEHLYEDQVALYVRVGHPLLQKPDVGIADVADYPLVSQFLPGGFGGWFQGVLELAEKARPGCRVNRAQQCTSYPLLTQLALESDAVLLATDHVMRAGSGRGRFTRLPTPEACRDVQFAAAVLRSPPASPLARRFVEVMQEEVRAVHSDA